MRCLNCHYLDTKVSDSRDDGRTVRRRRQCLKCGARFTTYEKLELPKFLVIKRSGSLESYDRNKIVKGIKLAFEKRPFTAEQLENLTDDIEQELVALSKKEIKTSQIGNIVAERLKSCDQVAYLRFMSVYKCFKNAQTFIKEADKLVNS